MNDIKKFIKMFSISEIIEKVLITLSFFAILDMFNIPTIIIEKYEIIGILLVILIMCFFIINKKIINLLRINVYNYFDLFLVTSLISTIIYIVFVKFINYSDFKLTSIVVTEILLIIAIIIRLISLYKTIKELTNEEDKVNVYDIRDLFENKISNDNDNLIFLEEKDVSYDLLNRTKIIDDLYNIINFCKNKEKFIISLTGKWGSGKTTILNIVKQKLDKEKFVVVDSFDIWKYNNEKALIYGIVDEILKKSNINFSTLEIKKVVNSCVAMLSAKTDISINSSYSDNKILEKIKMTLEEYLNKNNKRVIFIVDNFERTNEDNILIILKTIATIFNINRFIYILSYDEDEMKSIFKEKLKINYDYMEKLIQLPLAIPDINQDNINEICTICLKNLLKHYGVAIKEIETYIPAIKLFNENIKDLRSFKRKINSIFNSCFYGSNYLNKIDSFLIELINQENPELYDAIRKNYEYFVSEDQVVMYGYSMQSAQSFNENATKFFDDLFKKEENKKFKKILSLLFPNVEKYLNYYRINGKHVEFINESNYIISRDKEMYRQSIIERRIYNAKFFGLYFTKQQNEFIAIDSKIKEFIKWNNEKEYSLKGILNIRKKINNILYLYAGVGQKYILETFEIHIKEIEKNKLTILMCLISSQKYIDDTLIFFGLNAKKRLELVCAELIKLLSIEELNLLKEIIKEEYRNMYFIRGILYWLNPENNYNIQEENEKIYKELNESYISMIENVINEHINIYSKDNYSRYNIFCLMKNEDYKSQINNINENTVFEFLADMIKNSLGEQYGYSIDLEEFNKLTSFEKIDSILENIDNDSLDDIEKFIKDVYIKSKEKETNPLLDENTIYVKEYIDVGKVKFRETT